VFIARHPADKSSEMNGSKFEQIQAKARCGILVTVSMENCAVQHDPYLQKGGLGAVGA
jgi:hypothetical protein